MERLEDELAPRQERREPRPAWMREERRHERADAKRDNVAEVIKAEGSVLGTRLG
jgi:hypothetical protein